MTRIATLAVLGLSLAACRDGGGGGDDDPINPDTAADTGDGSVKISAIHGSGIEKGAAVSVKGVVVTAIDKFGMFTGDFWIQDPAGGPFSGVKVFRPPVSQVAALSVGDLVDITGAVKDEFAQSSDTSGRTLTELKDGGAMQIIRRGTGTVPQPVEVDAVALAAMDTATRQAEWEKWEGVLIKVVNARQIAALRSFGANEDQTEFRITGVARVQSGAAALPDTNGFGVCYASITGIGDYVFNDLIIPRSTDDVELGGTGCRPMAMSVASLQSGTNTEVVDLTNVVVVARDDLDTNNKGFWIADALQAAPHGGVYVYTRNVAAPATFVPGAVLSLKGAVDEFDLGSGGNPPMGDTLTEIVEPILPPAATGTGVPLPVAVSAEIAGDIGAAGEPYEGVLVRISNVKVTNLDAGQGKIELTDNANKKIIMDNEAFNWTAPALNTCYATLTGIMSVQINDNVRTINPRAADDFVVGTACAQ